MLRILVAVDGSDSNLRAVRYLVKLVAGRPGTEIHLLNVQAPLSAAVSGFLAGKSLDDFHAEEGKAALRAAEGVLDGAGLPYESHVAVGDVAETIVRYGEKRQCDQILMSTRGLGPVPNLLLGSVATKVLHLAKVPVTFVK